jgi:hypothetical protein
MTSTLTHPRPIAHPLLIVVAALVAAALVVVVLAFTVWGSGGSGGGSDVDVRTPRIETGSATGGDISAATQSYRDRLQDLNTKFDGYSNVAVWAPGIDDREAVCDLTGPC